MNHSRSEQFPAPDASKARASNPEWKIFLFSETPTGKGSGTGCVPVRVHAYSEKEAPLPATPETPACLTSFCFLCKIPTTACLKGGLPPHQHQSPELFARSSRTFFPDHCRAACPPEARREKHGGRSTEGEPRACGGGKPHACSLKHSGRHRQGRPPRASVLHLICHRNQRCWEFPPGCGTRQPSWESLLTGAPAIPSGTISHPSLRDTFPGVELEGTATAPTIAVPELRTNHVLLPLKVIQW